MNRKLKICHFTSVHPSNDTRVFKKQCTYLAYQGHDVDLVVFNQESKIENNVNIISINVNYKSIFTRFLKAQFIFFKYFKTKEYDIIQFHDPELLPIGLVLKKFYKRNVIFDIHENFLGQIKSRNYGIKTPFIHLIAKLLNRSAAKNLNLLLAEDSYAKEYKGMNANYEIIHNYPDHILLSNYATTERSKKRDIFYVGLISRDRNIINILKSLIILKKTVPDFHFHCIGPIIDGLENEFPQLENYDKIKDNITFYGRIDLEKAYKISMKCRFGLAILKPTPNYLESYPTKVFEYYCVGLPVVSSNFEIYKEIVGKFSGGVMVNPLNPNEIADAYNTFYTDNRIDEKSKDLIENVSMQFNWEHEAKKLESFYYSLI